MAYKYLNYSGKRPSKTYSKLLLELIEYLKIESKKGHYPSRRELEQNFHFRLGEFCKGIKELYLLAGVKYSPTRNQHIKSKKANLLLKIITSNLKLLNLKLIASRTAHEKGVDILAKKLLELN